MWVWVFSWADEAAVFLYSTANIHRVKFKYHRGVKSHSCLICRLPLYMCQFQSSWADWETAQDSASGKGRSCWSLSLNNRAKGSISLLVTAHLHLHTHTSLSAHRILTVHYTEFRRPFSTTMPVEIFPQERYWDKNIVASCGIVHVDEIAAITISTW